MKRIGIYARVSTQEEKQLNAYETQVQELTKYVNNQDDWQLYKVYGDRGISGTEVSKRKAYQEMIRDIEAGNIDIMVMKDEYRLNRNTLEGLKYLKLLIENDVQLFFYLEKKWYDKERDLDIKIKFIVAEEQSKDLSKKINSAHKTRMEKGRICVTGRMWGYDIKNAELHINEEQAKIVRLVYEMYAEGKGFRLIQNELRERGIMNSNGNEFSLTTLKRMIKNPKYKGTAIMNQTHKDFYTKKTIKNPKEEWIIHEDACPAIVSKELWERANTKLESKRKMYGFDEQRRLAGYWQGSYVYSKKIYCGECGQVYWHQQPKTMNHDLWGCSTAKSKGIKACGNDYIFTYVLDDIVKRTIFDFWKNKEDAINKVIDVLSVALEDNNYDAEIKDLERVLNKKKNRSQNLFDMRMDGEISKEEFAIQKEKLDTDIIRTETELNELIAKNKDTYNRKERIQNIKKFMTDSVAEPSNLSDGVIDHFLEKIIVYKDTVEIYLFGDFMTVLSKLDKNTIESTGDIKFSSVTESRPFRSSYYNDAYIL